MINLLGLKQILLTPFIYVYVFALRLQLRQAKTLVVCMITSQEL